MKNKSPFLSLDCHSPDVETSPSEASTSGLTEASCVLFFVLVQGLDD